MEIPAAPCKSPFWFCRKKFRISPVFQIIQSFAILEKTVGGCIRGSFSGNYRVANKTGHALSGIRVDNFSLLSLTGKNFAQAQL